MTIKRLLLFTIPLVLGLIAVGYVRHRATLHPDQIPFSLWYASHSRTYSTNGGAENVYTYVYTSPILSIDKLYKSMQGPTVSEPISMASTWQKLKQYIGITELYWITGYSVEILDAEDNDRLLSPEFMCHNNLNILYKEKMPWIARTYGVPLRLFTLTQGQTSIELPRGYGIPVLADMKLQINSQVLNHNQPLIHKKVRHRVTIHYLKDSELTSPMTALFEQSVLVTRQCRGPVGEHDTPPYTVETDPLSFMDIDADPEPVCCSMEKRDSLEYNPYSDSYGRAFTGHWNFHPGGPEINKTDVTRMLGLVYDTPLHFISVHVHPYCESLELIDKSENKSIYKALVQNSVGKTGMDRIDFLSSIPGIVLYKDHRYELVSTYRNTTTQDQTAMAVMFLYLEDKERIKN
ncbi:MAG TPA: hypothetical protein VNZ86_07480 [Bacteroidia bacterium]|nr:hypothetical protein [Bacteroidia bacterium]